MPKLTDRLAKRAKRAVHDAELHVLAHEGRKSIEAKVARARRVTKKALKAGAIAGAVVATAVVLRERRKRRALDG